jgi:hypothetical protein
MPNATSRVTGEEDIPITTGADHTPPGRCRAGGPRPPALISDHATAASPNGPTATCALLPAASPALSMTVARTAEREPLAREDQAQGRREISHETMG